jgi:pimeloyl-ACP methyl ester carboxylesterase
MRTRRTGENDELIRLAERAAYAHYGLAPQERIVRLAAPDGPIAVRVTSFGQEDSKDPPVLVLHGIASVSVFAAQVIGALATRRVIAVDWPGHGLSGPDELPVGTMVRPHATAIVRALLDELGLAEVDVVGHSMGAQFGLYAGLDLPERVRRIIVLGAPGAAFSGIRPTGLMIALAVPGVGTRLLRAPSSRKSFVRVNEKSLGKGALRDVPAQLVTAAYLVGRRPTYARSIASYFRTMIRGTNVRPAAHIPIEELRLLRQPTLLIWGEEDIFLSAADAAEHIAAIPNSTLLTLPEAGHAPWLQYPDVVGRAVADHLDGTTAATVTQLRRTIPFRRTP